MYKLKAKDVAAIRSAISANPTYRPYTKEFGHRVNYDTGVETPNLELAPLNGGGNNTDVISPYPLIDLKGMVIQLAPNSTTIKIDFYLYSNQWDGWDNNTELEDNCCVLFNTITGTAELTTY
jgi:hypothetical protein